ncbi:annexin ANXC4 [Cordyceps fumosorosea ARSEF 2679]|uniref:Annexin ANXC4 n=1 Tax=Cordyceps fumosorosea (strain ARSEF 2679) TaxID=1081104 RepID=A0A168D3V4_CORFA|nr:annexin ANXC4 [Cordyceps fumosorosea ARSEF 2679]OAA72140.1 annexin ANXC4 [Cordyceps fumosorosea ARSEF 2679]
MSLAVQGERHRDRSRSRSRDRRPKDEPERGAISYADIRGSGYGYPGDVYGDRYDDKYTQPENERLAYPSGSNFEPLMSGAQPAYQYDEKRSSYRDNYSRSDSPESNHLPGSFPDEDRPRRGEKDARHKSRKETRGERNYSKYDYDYDDKRDNRHSEARRDRQDTIEASDDRLKYLPQKYSQNYDDKGDTRGKVKHTRPDFEDEALTYGGPPPFDARSSSPPTYGSYIPGSSAGDKRRSKYEDDYHDNRRRSYSLEPEDRLSRKPKSNSYREYLDDPRSSKSSALAVESSQRKRDRSRDARRLASPGPALLTAEPDKHGRGKSRERSRDRRSSERESSPMPPTTRMSTLTVDTNRPVSMSLAAAPGSPLLESYHGTYQDCSPMPSPLLLASQAANEAPNIVDALSPLNSDVEGDSRKRNRRARFHDPEDIASRLARALKGDRPPDTEPLIEILPSLSHDQVMELRTKYKRIVKTGSERKGVNIAKHVRARLKDEDAMLMKACYSVALGMWESEAYWANFWYQGDKTRRELLIETLMGRTNDEVRRIKDAFTDKKYDNSLTKCMKTELKEDKFKKAVLTVLEERRMEDYDHYGRTVPLDYDLVDRDVDELRKAVKAEKGGETLMIAIVLQRSDTHLRAVLKEYERHYRGNFAREALKKSGNLVGELLAHILNGVINRPVRDALLLHHALTASRKDALRRELLVSRLVRYHWDPMHMQAVKRAYSERYGRELQDAVRDATSGEWGIFCLELCIARMPNHVRRIERVSGGGR